jgi:hypothetical protein
MLVFRRKRAPPGPTQAPCPVPLAALRTPPDHTWCIGTTYAGRRRRTDGGRDASLSQSPVSTTRGLRRRGGSWIVVQLAHGRAGTCDGPGPIPSRRLPDAAIRVDAGHAAAIVELLPDDDRATGRAQSDLVENGMIPELMTSCQPSFMADHSKPGSGSGSNGQPCSLRQAARLACEAGARLGRPLPTPISGRLSKVSSSAR